MKGKVAFANLQHRRYAVLTDDGDYTLFALLQVAEVAVGDFVTGNLTAVGDVDFSIGGSSGVNVLVEKCRCQLTVAQRWVEGDSI